MSRVCSFKLAIQLHRAFSVYGIEKSDIADIHVFFGGNFEDKVCFLKLTLITV